MPFSIKDRIKALLWCDRHCCLCGKQCGVFISLHHIVPEAKSHNNKLENAIPLCQDCHGAVGHYKASHPIGTKYSPNELRTRRDQIYERYTSRLVPPVLFRLTQALNPIPRVLPVVGFEISHLASDNPVKAFVSVSFPGPSKQVQSAYYNGNRAWNLNPRTTINGHFSIEKPYAESSLTFRIDVTLEDSLERKHSLLPLAYTFSSKSADWYLEPSPP